MPGKRKPFVRLQCEVCKRINYYTRKSKQKKGEAKLAFQKFCKWCKKQTAHKEAKK